MRPRFSLRRTLAFVAALGLGLAALTNPNSWWASGLLTATIASVVWSIIVWALCGRSAPFAVGYCVAATTFFVITMTSWGMYMGDRLPTSSLLAIWATQVLRKSPDEVIPYQLATAYMAGLSDDETAKTEWLFYFFPIGNCLWTIVLGSFSGSVRCCSRQKMAP